MYYTGKVTTFTKTLHTYTKSVLFECLIYVHSFPTMQCTKEFCSQQTETLSRKKEISMTVENQKIHPLQNRHRHTLTNHKPKKVEKISFCFSAMCLCMRFLAAASGSIFCLLMGKMNLYPNKLFMVTRELQKKIWKTKVLNLWENILFCLLWSLIGHSFPKSVAAWLMTVNTHLA